MVDIDDKLLAPLKSKDYEGFLKLGTAYADVVIRGEDTTGTFTHLIEESSNNDRRFEINIEEEDQLFESYYNIYTELAG